MKDLNDIAEQRWMVSSIDKTLPMRARPKRLREDPSLANERIESADPRYAVSRADNAVPSLKIP
jgi:hypothetical protein